MPPATGSVTFAKTIGIVRVSRWRATVSRVPFYPGAFLILIVAWFSP
jgi:hypothetical protein